METKKYIELICKNCGGHELKVTGNYFTCQNCRSLYTKKDFKKRLIYRQSKLFWVSIVTTVIVIGLVISFSIAPQSTIKEKRIEHPKSWYDDIGPGNAYKNVKEKEKSDRLSAEIDANAKWGLEHLDLTKAWTTEYFNSIQVAQMNFKDGALKPTYSKGMLFSDLVKKVGAPDELEDYGNNTKQALFHYHEENQRINRWAISIFIVYDTRTGMITSKSVMG